MTSWDEKIKTRQLLSLKNKALWIFLAAAFLYASGNVAVKPAMKLVSNYNFLIWREFAWFGVLLVLMPLIFHGGERKILRTQWRGALGTLLIAVLIQYFGYVLLFYSLGFSVQLTEGLMASGGLFAVIIGFVLLFFPGIYLACKLAFTPYLVVDRKMQVIEAVKESWYLTKGHGWKVFLIGLLGFPIGIAGLICFGVGIIISIMWISLALASLYHSVSLSGQSSG